MRIAVTGGTGYLGAHTVKTLLEAGHSVRLLVAPG
nr:nucleoside-diphosphate-sugar epimerase [Mycolicibacter nonchromogenicus]